jgi:leader peptidase (prepilin peptidase)/N-methyltransferase
MTRTPVATNQPSAVSDAPSALLGRLATVPGLHAAWSGGGRWRRSIAVAGSVGAVAVAVRWSDGRGAVALASAAAFVVLVAAALVDAVDGRLPDPLVLVGGTPVALVAVMSIPFGDAATATRVAAGAALLAGPLLAVHLADPSAVGFGDVKAGAVLGAALGALAPLLGLLALCVASGLAASWALVTRRRTLAFGPWLVAGAVLVALAGDLLGRGVIR